jgi:Protein of unknown function (DUF1364)
MVDLTKLAKGQECRIRVPSYCNGNPDTSVWCHVRLSGISGMSLKSLDLFGAIGCNPCHDVVDGRTKTTFSYGERRLMLLEGMLRTQAWLEENGILVFQPEAPVRAIRLPKIVPRRL